MTYSSLRSLLERWANLEPQRCCYTEAETFSLLYQEKWYSIESEDFSSHGLIIMAILSACDARDYCYSIERIPYPASEWEDDSQPQLLVGVGMKDAWRSKEGKNLAPLLPRLLLREYLNFLEKQIDS